MAAISIASHNLYKMDKNVPVDEKPWLVLTTIVMDHGFDALLDIKGGGHSGPIQGVRSA